MSENPSAPLIFGLEIPRVATSPSLQSDLVSQERNQQETSSTSQPPRTLSLDLQSPSNHSLKPLGRTTPLARSDDNIPGNATSAWTPAFQSVPEAGVDGDFDLDTEKERAGGTGSNTTRDSILTPLPQVQRSSSRKKEVGMLHTDLLKPEWSEKTAHASSTNKSTTSVTSLSSAISSPSLLSPQHSSSTPSHGQRTPQHPFQVNNVASLQPRTPHISRGVQTGIQAQEWSQKQASLTNSHASPAQFPSPSSIITSTPPPMSTPSHMPSPLPRLNQLRSLKPAIGVTIPPTPSSGPFFTATHGGLNTSLNASQVQPSQSLLNPIGPISTPLVPSVPSVQSVQSTVLSSATATSTSLPTFSPSIPTGRAFYTPLSSSAIQLPDGRQGTGYATLPGLTTTPSGSYFAPNTPFHGQVSGWTPASTNRSGRPLALANQVLTATHSSSSDAYVLEQRRNTLDLAHSGDGETVKEMNQNVFYDERKEEERSIRNDRDIMETGEEYDGHNTTYFPLLLQQQQQQQQQQQLQQQLEQQRYTKGVLFSPAAHSTSLRYSRTSISSPSPFNDCSLTGPPPSPNVFFTNDINTIQPRSVSQHHISGISSSTPTFSNLSTYSRETNGSFPTQSHLQIRGQGHEHTTGYNTYVTPSSTLSTSQLDTSFPSSQTNTIGWKRNEDTGMDFRMRNALDTDFRTPTHTNMSTQQQQSQLGVSQRQIDGIQFPQDSSHTSTQTRGDYFSYPTNGETFPLPTASAPLSPLTIPPWLAPQSIARAFTTLLSSRVSSSHTPHSIYEQYNNDGSTSIFGNIPSTNRDTSSPRSRGYGMNDSSIKKKGYSRRVAACVQISAAFGLLTIFIFAVVGIAHVLTTFSRIPASTSEITTDASANSNLSPNVVPNSTSEIQNESKRNITSSSLPTSLYKLPMLSIPEPTTLARAMYNSNSTLSALHDSPHELTSSHLNVFLTTPSDVYPKPMGVRGILGGTAFYGTHLDTDRVSLSQRFPHWTKDRRLLPSRSAIEIPVFGDWGYRSHALSDVARESSAYFRGRNTPYVLSTGDNFYPRGLVSPSSTSQGQKDFTIDPAVERIFEDVFGKYSEFNVPWILSLGNHDCEGSVETLLEQARGSPFTRLTLPARYFHLDLELPRVDSFDSEKENLSELKSPNPDHETYRGLQPSNGRTISPSLLFLREGEVRLPPVETIAHRNYLQKQLRKEQEELAEMEKNSLELLRREGKEALTQRLSELTQGFTVNMQPPMTSFYLPTTPFEVESDELEMESSHTKNMPPVLFTPYNPISSFSAYYGSKQNHNEESRSESQNAKIRIIVLDTCVLSCENALDAITAYEASQCIATGKSLVGESRAEQLAWLEHIIADSSSDSSVVANILVGHHPIFSAGPHASNLALYKALSPALEDTKTSLYLSGHDHTMEHFAMKMGNRDGNSGLDRKKNENEKDEKNEARSSSRHDESKTERMFHQVISGSSAKSPHPVVYPTSTPPIHFPLKALGVQPDVLTTHRAGLLVPPPSYTRFQDLPPLSSLLSACVKQIASDEMSDEDIEEQQQQNPSQTQSRGAGSILLANNWADESLYDALTIFFTNPTARANGVKFKPLLGAMETSQNAHREAKSSSSMATSSITLRYTTSKEWTVEEEEAYQRLYLCVEHEKQKSVEKQAEKANHVLRETATLRLRQIQAKKEEMERIGEKKEEKDDDSTAEVEEFLKYISSPHSGPGPVQSSMYASINGFVTLRMSYQGIFLAFLTQTGHVFHTVNIDHTHQHALEWKQRVFGAIK